MFSSGETQFKYVPYEPHGVYPNLSLPAPPPSPNAAGLNQPEPSSDAPNVEEDVDQPPCWARPLARFLLFFFSTAAAATEAGLPATSLGVGLKRRMISKVWIEMMACT